MNVAITGSSGFIGTNLCSLFIKKNINFIGIDKKINPYIKIKNYYKLDLNNINKVDKIIKKNKINYIVHLAAVPGFVNCHINPKKSFDDNIKATFNLFLLAKKHKIKKIIFASSFSVDKFKENPSVYGLTKFTGESICKTFTKNYGLKITIARISNAFGLYSSHKESVVHEFLKKAINNKTLEIHSTGRQKRDFIFAEDVALKIYKNLINKKYVKNINICTNNFTSVLEVKNIIDSLTNNNNKFKFVKTPAGYDDTIYNIKKNKRIILLKNCLKKTYEWYIKNYN